MEEKLI